MKITQAENEAACSLCNRNQIPLIQLKQYSAFYCLICLRAAVQMLEQAQPTIQDRILAAIDQNGYRATWSIADELGIPRIDLQGHQSPTTEYEWALAKLVNGGVLEELPDLSYRYRRVTTDLTPT